MLTLICFALKEESTPFHKLAAGNRQPEGLREISRGQRPR